MFDISELPDGPVYAALDAAEAELVALESEIAQRRARQSEIIAWLDRVHVARVQGSRSIEEWTAAHLDVAPTTARDLVTTARARKGGPVTGELDEGTMSFDRAMATLNLAAAGADAELLDHSRGRDLVGVRRLTAELKRVRRVDEREVMRQRHVTIKPTLGETAWQLSGLLPAYEGHLIANALDERIDELPAPPAGERESRDTRRADALASMALDTLDPPQSATPTDHDDLADEGDGGDGSSPVTHSAGSVTLFLEGDIANRTGGELGGTIAAGPRVGPDTIERILCGGTASIVTIDKYLRPVATTTRNSTIPPAIRDAVIHRDGGCAIDGCRSRYRLQVHHIRHRADGGTNDPDQLVTLCWYHHQIVIHGYGKRLDPDSPPHRRRFLYRPPPRQPRPPPPHLAYLAS